MYMVFSRRTLETNDGIVITTGQDGDFNLSPATLAAEADISFNLAQNIVWFYFSGVLTGTVEDNRFNTTVGQQGELEIIIYYKGK